ncbi:MAG: M23 family metallopeptidase [Clostridia bacterium]|nr:M23 family metallopeptidase [Clostridia bacterium]
MVEHSSRLTGEWVSTHPPAPKKEQPPDPPEKKPHRLSVVGVQSLACVVVLLLALLLRLAGGEAYTQLRGQFRQSLMSNDLLGALATLWEDVPPAGEESAVPESDITEAAGRLPPSGAVAVNLRVNRLAVAPVAEGVLTSGYGYRENPTGEGEQFHHGVDIAASAGTPIAAMYDGTVEQVGESRSLGNYICLAHGDGVTVLYAHCAAVVAEEGAHVRAGETVALVGSTGDSTGNHVHIQVSAHGTVYNPAGTVPLTAYA